MSSPSQKERTLSGSGSAIPGRIRTTSTGSGGGTRSRSGSFVGRVVLLAVDASEHAKFAFDWFLENVHKPDDLIVLVHCPETPNLPLFKFKSGVAPPLDEWKKSLDEMNSKTRRLEEDYEATLIQKKLKYKVRGESYKNPGEGICRIGEDERVDLIVMGARGLNSVKRTFVGSVSEHVVRNAGVPTLIIPVKFARKLASEASAQ